MSIPGRSIGLGRPIGGLGPAAPYVVATVLSTAGSAVGLLGATGSIVAAATEGREALTTGAFLGLLLLASAVGTLVAPRLSGRSGVRATFARVQLVYAAAWVVAGAALLLGAPAFPTLLVAAVPIGVVTGLLLVLRPLLNKAYLGSAHTADAYARMAVANGIAWGLGALIGGLLLGSIALGWGLVINGLLSVPLALVVRRVAPVSEPVSEPAAASASRASGRPWQDARMALSTNRVLFWSAVLGIAIALFLAPIGSLVVPIASDLRQQPEVTGAGFLLAAFAVGEVLSPTVVRRLSARRHALPAASVSLVVAGLSMLALGVVSAFLTRRPELAVWMAIGVVFGAFHYSFRAISMGAAADSGPPEEAPVNLAVAAFAGLLAAPLGVLLISLVIDITSAETAVLIGGAGAVAAALAVSVASRSAVGHSPRGDPRDDLAAGAGPGGAGRAG